MLMRQASLSAACSRPCAWAGLQVSLVSALLDWPASMHACLLVLCHISTGPSVHALSAPWQPLQKHRSVMISVLLLMAGVEAQLMIPRALTVLESSKSAQQAWLGAWGDIPLHVLLPWAAQMLSLLGSSEGAALLPALKVSTGPILVFQQFEL